MATSDMPGVVIRVEHADDREAVDGLVAEAFDSLEHADLVRAIRASEHFIPELALVAESDGQIVGYVMISGAELHDGRSRHRVATLSPLAVHPSVQRRGIGSALIREALHRAQLRGRAVVLLEGDPGFYSRFGFEPAAPHGIEFTLPAWAPPEAGQVMFLSTDGARPTGRVVYPEAFNLVEG